MADLNITAGRRDIEYGLGLLASLVRILQDNDNSCPAQVALAQKIGALIERGAVSSGVMSWAGICGNVESWMGMEPSLTDMSETDGQPHQTQLEGVTK